MPRFGHAPVAEETAVAFVLCVVGAERKVGWVPATLADWLSAIGLEFERVGIEAARSRRRRMTGSEGVATK
jgi:hypothetical protein